MSDKGTIVDRLTDVKTNGGKLARISISRVGAEGTSILCGFGGLLVAQGLMKESLEPLRNFVAKHIVQPNLGLFEQTAHYLPSLQTPDETKELEAMTPEGRAKSYADGLVNMSLAVMGGLGGQIAGQMLFDHVSSVPNIGTRQHLKVAMIDRTMQLGVIIGLNTLFSQPSIDAQKKLGTILHKQLGMDEAQAKSSADYLVNWQVPNVGGALAAVAAHFHFSKGMRW